MLLQINQNPEVFAANHQNELFTVIRLFNAPGKGFFYQYLAIPYIKGLASILIPTIWEKIDQEYFRSFVELEPVTAEKFLSLGGDKKVLSGLVCLYAYLNTLKVVTKVSKQKVVELDNGKWYERNLYFWKDESTDTSFFKPRSDESNNAKWEENLRAFIKLCEYFPTEDSYKRVTDERDVVAAKFTGSYHKEKSCEKARLVIRYTEEQEVSFLKYVIPYSKKF